MFGNIGIILCEIWLVLVAVTLTNSDIISVSRDVNGKWKVNTELNQDVTDVIVVANLTDRQTETGWLYLDITSNEAKDDQDQALAAGIAEGYLTSNAIYGYYKEFIHKGFCTVDPQFCEFIREKFQQNLNWIKEMTKVQNDEGRSSSYWKMVNLFHSQLEGLKIGWLMKAEENGDSIPEDFDVTWFAYFINFYPDAGDYIYNYKQFKKSNQSAIVFTAPSCSVLIKKVEKDVLIGHATWHVYESMWYRLIKRYNLNYHTVSGDLIAGHTMTMSSHAGNIFSLDDYYSVSTGLGVLETTLFVYDQTLMEKHNPSGQHWEPVRVMVANRLANSGKEWTEIFSRYNSGTYNNQWMVVDYNKVKEGVGDVLWVLEQLPDKIMAKDMTEVFNQQTYWASYNRAYFDDIVKLSGAPDMIAKNGNWFSHDQTPRALLFREGQNSVIDEDSMMTLLRSNNYLQSSHSTPPGCSGPVPSAAIASRSDLQWSNVSCSWQLIDYMVGKRAYGAIDAKVMSSKMAKSLSFLAVAGPTTSNQPPFDWKSQSGVNQNVPIQKFDFKPEYISWRSTDIETTTATTTATPASIEPFESSSTVSVLNFLYFIIATAIFYIF